MTSPAAEPFGSTVLAWLLRRMDRGTSLASYDLVLVRDHEVLADAGSSLSLGDESWRVGKATGELTLRDLLPEADRLVAMVPLEFVVPMDLAGRAYLGRALDVDARDVVAAVAGRFCQPLDEELGAAVFQGVDLLREQARLWSLTGVVTPGEVRKILVSAELGTHQRLDREPAAALLARWIVEGPPQVRLPGLLRQALQEAHRREGGWLAWALTEGSIPALVAAGALAESEAGRRLAPAVPELSSPAEWRDLRRLVEQAVRDAHARVPEQARQALVEAERLGHRLELGVEEAGRLPLLRAALEKALHAHARAAAAGEPADDAVIEVLRANLHAPVLREAIDLVRGTARLARFIKQIEPLPAGSSADDWLRLARDSVAWADLGVRRLRRALPGAPADLAGPARTVLEQALRRRDEQNAAFANVLARMWKTLSARKDLRLPLPLHQVGRSLLRRLVEDGQRVLLVVLDGCDLSTFIELLDELAKSAPLGLRLPPVQDALLRQDLQAASAFHVAVAPLPPVTSHARRALFAGEIPGNTALDDTESAPANATADREAFSKSAALGPLSRQLLLKGELGSTGQPLLQALRDRQVQLLAVVFNGVDDALASHETTALGPWSFEALGAGAIEALQLATAEGWTVVVTADHGHTPHLETTRKVSPRAAGSRYDRVEGPGTVRFDDGPLPARPLFLLTDVGAWHGTQRRGYHGGAGLEEVAVPLAFLGRIEPGEGRPVAPAWWWSLEAGTVEARLPAPLFATPVPVATVQAGPAGGADLPATAAELPHLPVDVRTVLSSRPLLLQAVEALAVKRVLTGPQLAKVLGKPALFVGGMLSTAMADLARAGVAVPFDREEAGGEVIFRWKED